VAPSSLVYCNLAALDEYIRRRKQMQILDLFDTIDYHGDYDYKANRRHDQIETER
jgi:hypothetical protein